MEELVSNVDVCGRSGAGDKVFKFGELIDEEIDGVATVGGTGEMKFRVKTSQRPEGSEEAARVVVTLDQHERAHTQSYWNTTSIVPQWCLVFSAHVE